MLERGLAQSAELGRVHGLHRARVGAGRLVVGEDRAEMDVLGLQEVEDRPVVGLVLAREVEMRVARVVSDRGHRRVAVELDVDRQGLAGGQLHALARGPILESLPGFDAHRPGRDDDLDVSGRIEGSAEVADRSLALSVPFTGIGPPAGQAVGGERVGRGLIEVAVGSDDIDPAGRRPSRGAIADRDPEAGGFLARRRLRQAGLREAGRGDDDGLVIRRGAIGGDQDEEPGRERRAGRSTSRGRLARSGAVPRVGSHEVRANEDLVTKSRPAGPFSSLGAEGSRRIRFCRAVGTSRSTASRSPESS